MSDRENGTKDSDDDSPVVSKRRSRSSRSRSRSRSRKRYSRSRSRSGSRGRKYYSRSRSRSPYYKRRRSRYSRSRSRSYSPYSRHRSSSYRSRYHSRSRSPMSNRRRHLCSRFGKLQEDPKVSRCVGVFGLSLYTQERDLREVFGRYGPLEEVQVVYDHQTGRSRGFAFLYFRNLEDAMEVSKLQAIPIPIFFQTWLFPFSLKIPKLLPTSLFK
ncbi:hypothetical protein LSH36_153g02036 [Paralvinella palmiformis]|uniref:RRM domain-containing protein n=1 Tax=Paralvinella palmiformis TaxID=53620 RepID=A0AAD9JUK0_9ANNE|nr:hypothetical protein LSH36_153g02036 [Paralvinella palmiformis]